ncbi:hypothetical protein P0W64_17850 [Tsukamurella sp. 8F]|uniref:DUF6802 family protein n=1 Tax=unclassified Tsukamurella TaxID=2633480 RepID=UPI0023B9AED5|nr:MULTISPECIES: DUF6802 family protein [unclassified Tsukamurella]MDF0529895.1 hypothetical protein [Tsukamurella sp. 8J]MDF0588650.1 hypothetical protein [Tsukamurella sp. 8F]
MRPIDVDDLFSDPFAPDLFDAAAAGDGPTQEGLWVSVGDGWFDVSMDGAVDTDGDGRDDTATVHAADRLAVFADLDADGVADVYHSVAADGTFQTWTYSAERGWALLDRGDLE